MSSDPSQSAGGMTESERELVQYTVAVTRSLLRHAVSTGLYNEHDAEAAYDRLGELMSSAGFK